jgi:hypothetical protein
MARLRTSGFHPAPANKERFKMAREGVFERPCSKRLGNLANLATKHENWQAEKLSFRAGFPNLAFFDLAQGEVYPYVCSKGFGNSMDAQG